MSGSTCLEWAVVILFAVLSIVLLMGKGSFLLAGYNTASKKEKSKYNEKRLCRVVGGGLGIITIFLAVDKIYESNLPFYLQWINPRGSLVVIAAILILGNTICKKK